MRAVISILAAAAMIAVAGAAFAKAPPPAPVYTWTGYYAGIHAGYGFGGGADANFDPATFATLIPSGGLAVTGSSGPFGLSVSPSGGFGGVQIGRNWQDRDMIFGFEADISGGDINDEKSQNFSVTANDPDTLDFTGTFNLRQSIPVFGTVRGRVGWTSGDTLLYLTGGLAWGYVETEISVSNIAATVPANFPAGFPAALNRSASFDSLEAGVAAGLGAETPLDNKWTLKGEYMFTGLFTGDTGTGFTGATVSSNDVLLHIFRVGLNYHWQ